MFGNRKRIAELEQKLKRVMEYIDGVALKQQKMARIIDHIKHEPTFELYFKTCYNPFFEDKVDLRMYIDGEEYIITLKELNKYSESDFLSGDLKADENKRTATFKANMKDCTYVFVIDYPDNKYVYTL